MSLFARLFRRGVDAVPPGKIRTAEGELLGFGCCYCAEGIEPVSPDICMVMIITNWDKPKKQQNSQGFWCDGECFRSALGIEARPDLAVLDPDF